MDKYCVFFQVWTVRGRRISAYLSNDTPWCTGDGPTTRFQEFETLKEAKLFKNRLLRWIRNQKWGKNAVDMCSAEDKFYRNNDARSYCTYHVVGIAGLVDGKRQLLWKNNSLSRKLPKHLLPPDGHCSSHEPVCENRFGYTGQFLYNPVFE